MKFLNKIKENILNKQKLKQKKGIALLYSVMLSSIILAITLGVVNVSLKEIKFSTESRHTNDAFFAADTGIECALYYDSVLDTFTSSQTQNNINCGDMPSQINMISSSTTAWSYKFIVSQLGDSRKGCAIVNIEKTNSPTTKIISKGYNIGGEALDQCNILNSVERQIEVNY